MNKTEKILNYIKLTYAKYELKNDVDHIIVSSKLHKLIERIGGIVTNDGKQLWIIENTKLKDMVFFFVKGTTYRIPEKRYSIVDKEIEYPGIKVTRTISPLDTEVRYNIEIAAKMTMSEIAFCLAQVIVQMDTSGNCKAEDMIGMINTYFK